MAKLPVESKALFYRSPTSFVKGSHVLKCCKMLNANFVWLHLVFAAVTAIAPLDLPAQFADPPSNEVDFVDPLIGNGGHSPNGSGGMIPSTAPPFAMTR
ncbi:hypothetical protein A0H81_14550 [Grifola frondosa]|uniref:Uncharacterized protein n=1 Tax=Grifola frondosa TaxID=5627 RepID=A0A1C7LL28_GRIFR|nr:hypothetical protein A0H81_14550 [Grifola frondosa]